jgi:hypothetical protein
MSITSHDAGMPARGTFWRNTIPQRVDMQARRPIRKINDSDRCTISQIIEVSKYAN